MNQVRRVDQGMAAAAADILGDGTISDEIRTRYRQLPIMLHVAGLPATCAYVVAKRGDKEGIGQAYRSVAQGICTHLKNMGLLSDADPSLLVGRLSKMSPDQYARASMEVSLLAGWLSRLADAAHKAQKAGG